jgi:hypothetical protein
MQLHKQINALQKEITAENQNEVGDALSKQQKMAKMRAQMFGLKSQLQDVMLQRMSQNG